MKSLVRSALASFLFVPLAALSSCAREVPFALCADDYPKSNFVRITLSFERGQGAAVDVVGDLVVCGDADDRPCLDFPLLLSFPETFPARVGGVETWRVGEREFSATRQNDDQILIETGVEGGRRSVIYDLSDGVTGLIVTNLDVGYSDTWSRCEGRLMKADLEAFMQGRR